VVLPAGMVTLALPLFGELSASTTGKLVPPLVESEIFTLAALIGTLVVPATSHVTLKGVPGVRVVALFCELMRKGPALLLVVTCIEPQFCPPPPARLSRTETR
jgi:hypothetical protein